MGDSHDDDKPEGLIDDVQAAARRKEFARRTLLRAGWTVPLITTVNVPSAFAQTPAPHTDHTDVPHTDHVDAPHTDHADVPHSDHADIPHQDHQDHLDVHADAHSDSHTDVHTDVHSDLPHTDVPHVDI